MFSLLFMNIVVIVPETVSVPGATLHAAETKEKRETKRVVQRKERVKRWDSKSEKGREAR